METVSVLAIAVCGLDLNTPTIAARIEDEVIAVALSPRLGYAEAETGGFVEESGFSQLATALGWQMCVGRWTRLAWLVCVVWFCVGRTFLSDAFVFIESPRTGHEQTIGVRERKFIHLCQYKDGAWKVTRVISYDHHAAAK